MKIQQLNGSYFDALMFFQLLFLRSRMDFQTPVLSQHGQENLGRVCQI